MCKTADHRPHTIDHVNCPGCQALDELIEADLLGMANQAFSEAAKVWQRLRRNSSVLRSRTHEGVDEYTAALTKFFGGIVMRSINPGMLKAYQMARQTNAIALTGKVHSPWSRKTSNSRINHELNVVVQMLCACNEWKKIRLYYFPFPVPGWSPHQILSETEEEEQFRKVAGYTEAELAYFVAGITNITTASGVELRSLKLENVYLRPRGRYLINTFLRRPARTTTAHARSC